ncbi:zinc finger protein, putative [Plasmodium vinckei brucechwatti]|uniref:Zinc finger protein, putative n=1 Tax=Plasmodium vinckei brucechwatti TaxID=119398 RepID=A0A6V7S8L1_PLAVN|nr:zinc finger protein, putative [Plasmodium vinckei brucechwatti]
MAYFSNFIQKCQFEGCRYHDFLPHKCEYCELLFCELHKKAQDHVCSKLKHSDLKKVILCEYCNAVIPDDEEEIKWHLLYKCTYVKKTNKPKICDREKCKTVKNKIDTYKFSVKRLFVCPTDMILRISVLLIRNIRRAFWKNTFFFIDIFKKEEHELDKSYKKFNRKMKVELC